MESKKLYSAFMIFFWGLYLSTVPISKLVAFETSDAAQQDIKATLFKEALDALKGAKQVHADLLSPQNFNEALEYYHDAEKDYDKGKNLDDIRKKLRASVNYLKKATEATKLAEVTLMSAIKARADATQAGAPQFATNGWAKGESKFAEAAGKLEDGDVNAAKSKAGEAETLFRQAELDAIKANYLTDTWNLLKQADDKDVKKYAPSTLVQAQTLVQKAEKELNENRYDKDVARSLARQAKYEAQHALYLSSVIKELRDDKNKLEDFILNSEKPLTQIAATMDIVGSFEAGFDKTTNEIIEYVKALQDSAAGLDQDLSERDQQLEMLSARIAEMEEKLGGIEEEKSALALQMEAQAKIREQFTSVEKLFLRDEATVLRKVNDIIIRLVGINFPVGKATIEPQNFSLLTKVQQSIGFFPDCKITIEGHTDSYGSDDMNLRLSQQRADAVSQYILANMGIDASRINAVGYGETSPIANNETVEGRTKNRRIEVVIHPQF